MTGTPITGTMTATGATIADALTNAARYLAAAGIHGARAEARLLVGHVLDARPELLVAHPDRVIDAQALSQIQALVSRRADREPMSHLLGRREFWGLDFKVDRRVLDPRPDSETVITAVLACLEDRAAELGILDLGTGTGCLLLALLSELPGAQGTGVDMSTGAVAVARDNAASLGFGDRSRFLVDDWAAAINGSFQVIVANPPYVASPDMAALAPEIARFEPMLALDGGPDGFGCYGDLAAAIARLLAPGGFAVVEIGSGQAIEVTEIFSALGLHARHVHRDLAGIERCLMLKRDAILTKN